MSSTGIKNIKESIEKVLKEDLLDGVAEPEEIFMDSDDILHYYGKLLKLSPKTVYLYDVMADGEGDGAAFDPINWIYLSTGAEMDDDTGGYIVDYATATRASTVDQALEFLEELENAIDYDQEYQQLVALVRQQAAQ